MMSVLIILSLLCNGDGSAVHLKRTNCAVDVAYAAFRSARLKISYEAVAELFPEHLQQFGAQVPMTVLQDVLANQGLSTIPVRYDTRKIEDLSTPSILLIYPQGIGPSALGHYVFLKRVTENEVDLIDSNALGEEMVVSKELLERFWGGHALLLAPDNWLRRMMRCAPFILPFIAIYQVLFLIRWIVLGRSLSIGAAGRQANA